MLSLLFSAADPEKTSEIDDSGPHHAGAIDNHVDDMSHILVRRAANVATEHAMGFARADHRDRGRRRWFLGSRRRCLRLSRLRWRVCFVFGARCGAGKGSNGCRHEDELASCGHMASFRSVRPP